MIKAAITMTAAINAADEGGRVAEAAIPTIAHVRSNITNTTHRAICPSHTSRLCQGQKAADREQSEQFSPLALSLSILELSQRLILNRCRQRGWGGLPILSCIYIYV